MDEDEFLQSLKTDDEKFNEFVAGAEHFVRLKQQSGYEQPAAPPTEKKAGVGARLGLGALNFTGGALGKGIEAADDIRNLAVGGSAGRAHAAGRVAVGAGSLGGAYALGKSRGKSSEKKAASSLGGVLGSTLIGAGLGAASGAAKKDGKRGHTMRSALVGGTTGYLTGLAGGTPSAAGKGLRSLASKIRPSHETKAVSALRDPKKNVDMGFDKMWMNTATEKRRPLDNVLVEAIKGPKVKAASELAEKRAGLAEKMKSLGPLSLGLMGGGAAAGGLGTYLASRPREELGGKSKAEDELEGMVEAHQKRPEHGLLHKMKNRTTELEHGYAKAFRDHPLKAGIIGAGAGATGGYGLARLLDAVRGAAR
jgi:hypothetical protein